VPGLNDLIERLSQSASKTERESLAPRVQKVRDYLAALTEVRVFIANSQNFGHQAASVNILRNLIRMGVPGPYTLLLYQEIGSIDNLVGKIKLLIPQFVALDQPFDIGGRQVTAIDLTNPLPVADFAVTGGFDDAGDKSGNEPPYHLIQVRNYVQLQPYRWYRGRNLVRQKPDGGSPDITVLDEEFPKTLLNRRAFYVADPVITEADWQAVAATNFAEQGRIVRYLLEGDDAARINLYPVYGIATRGSPADSLYNTISGVIAAQTEHWEAQAPTVVVEIQPLEAAAWARFLQYLTNPAAVALNPPSADFLSWHAQNRVAQQVFTLGSPGQPTTVAAVTAAVRALDTTQILVVYLGPVPAPLFSGMYAKSTFPPVLEGQSTMELMLNLGRPYLKITTDADPSFSYATLPITADNPSAVATQGHDISYNAIDGASARAWYSARPTFPPRALLPFLKAYLEPEGDPIAVDFTAQRAFFHSELQDKLLRGLDLFVNLVKPVTQQQQQQQQQLALAAAPAGVAVEAGGSALLEAFYQTLESNTVNGVLDLLRAVTVGMIPEFFTSVVTDTVFQITGALPLINPDKTLVTLTGTTTALGVGTTTLSFAFTDNGGAIVTQLGASFDEAVWAFPGAQWLSVKRPFMGLVLDANAGAPVVGTVGATFTAGFEAQVALTLPSEPGSLLLQVTFTDPRPSITNVFQMVGGINLQRILPPQIQLFTDIEVLNLAFRYSYATSTMQYIGLNMGTPPARTWALVPGVVVTGLTFGANIDVPGDVQRRKTRYQVGGQFALAGGKGSVNAFVPELRVSGGLTDDSPPVTVSAIVSSFLGASFAAALPASVGTTAITQLTFAVNQALGTYSFSMTVTTEWPVPSANLPLFTITGLGLSIDAVSRDINPPTGGAAGGSSAAGTEIDGTFTGSLVVLPKSANPVGLTTTATYNNVTKAWTFDAKQTSGVVSLAELLTFYLGGDWQPPAGQEYGIDGLGLTIASSPTDSSWVFTGKTAGTWTIPFLNVSLAARLKTGDAGLKAAIPGKFGRLDLDVVWQNIKITVFYDYNPKVQQYGITWGILQGILSEDVATGDWTVALKFTETVTVGSIIEEMISWLTGSRFGLEAPWSVLNSIPLNGLALKYTFNKADSSRNKVQFSVGIGPIDLGFARIDSIDVGYQSTGPSRGVNVKLVGSFIWNSGAGANGDTKTLGPWDASKPGAAPAPPGQGNKYLDLRLLAMGQHVTADCFPTATTVQKAIQCLGTLPPTDPGKLPAIRFDAESSWLIGADFGLLRQDPEESGGGGGGGAKTLAASAALPSAGAIPLGADTVLDLASGGRVPVGGGAVGEAGIAASAGTAPRASADASSGAVLHGPGTGPDGIVQAPGRAMVPVGSLALAPQAAAPTAAPKYFINLQVVFNDPRLYGLRIALDGSAAKIFKGLDFQIMYRQVSDTVGVYQAEITLPDVMRHLSIGVYSITLPVFGIAVYTNGDFMLDVGFPWNEDFSRSFTIEGIIYPGIPVLGSAGFYFGKLSSATTNRVPQATNGTFNPVIVFGFGLQVGFGKSVNYGILSAGFSLTLVGILEGVIAKWNPYAVTAGGGNDVTQVQGAYYFWLRGTVGIIGKLYGSVDFAIVKANVNVTIKLLLQLTYESFVSITITVIASVDVAVSVKIDLGLFSISIDFSFSMRLKESFSLKTDTNAPWIVDSGKQQSVLRSPSPVRLRAFRLPQGLMSLSASSSASPAWGNLTARPEGQKLPLTGWLAPGLTIARDEWQNVPTADQQVACYVAMLFIDSVPPTTKDTTSSAVKAAGGAADTPFETLAKTVFRWTVAAVQAEPHDAAYIDTVQLSDVDLGFLLDQVLVSSDANPTPIPPQAASDFMAGQFELTAKLPSDGVGPDTTYFPIPGELRLTIPSYPTPSQPGGVPYPGYSYTFGAYNSVSQTKLTELRRYFDDLAVQVQEEMDRQQAMQAMAEVEDNALSMSAWMFSDYFLLLARQMTQAARDALRTFKYPIAAGDDGASILAWTNATGELAGPEALTLLELFTANATHPLNPSAAGPLTIGVTLALDAAASFTEAAAEVGNGMTATLVAGANAADPAVLRAGAVIAWRDTLATAYTVKAGDTLASITASLLATNPGFTFEALLTGTDVLQAPGLLAAGATLLLPATLHAALSGDSFASVAALPLYGGGFDAAALARRGAGAPILRVGAQVKRSPTDDKPFVVQARNTLADAAAGLGMTMDQLLSQTAVLTQADLLATGAQLALPTFGYRLATKEETLESVSARFGVGVAVLAEQAANGGVADLFSTTDAAGAAAPYLDLPHLAQFPVGELLKEAQRSLALQQLSGMAARYSLHGLRIPADGISPRAGGMWVKGGEGSYSLPAQAGLFALTGQQFPLPDLAGQTAALPITFDRTGGPAWLRFKDEAGAATNTLVVKLEPASQEQGPKWTVQRVLNLVAFARAGRVDVALEKLGAEPVVQSELSSYPFTSQLEWQSAGTVPLPFGTPTGGVQQLRLWTVPNAMAALPDPATRGVNPRFRVEVARYDEGTGATVFAAPGPYGWASVIPFTVKRVPAVLGSAAVEETYEIVGADGAAIVLLERLLDEVRSDDTLISRLIVGYAPDQAGGNTQGVQTDDPAAVTMGIAQVNLSTVTRPPSGGGPMMAFSVEAVEPEGRLLNTPTAFLRLVWEASITRAGGFYLYYFDTADGRGLPERVFNDRNETVLSIVVLWAAGAQADQNRLTDYMTAVVTGEAIDTSSAVLFAQADPPANPMSSVSAGAADTLESLAYASYSDVGDVAEANAGLALSTAVRITVGEGVTQAPPGGIALSALAQQFGTTVAAIQGANGGALPDPVQFPTAVLLPTLTLTPGTSAGSGSLGGIAGYYGENLTALAAHNRTVAGLWAGQTVLLPGGPRVRNATVSAGVASVAGLRAMPDAVPQDPTAAGYGRLAVLNAYSLLQPQVLANVDFGASLTGLAAGPVTVPADGAGADKIRAPRTLVAGDDWDYRRSLPYAKFALNPPPDVPGLPPASASPYLGVGGVLQVTFDWLDYYGNALVTTLSTPLAGDPQPWNAPPVLTGYTDPIVGLSQWPSVSSSWRVTTGGGGAQLVVALGFDPSRYQGLISATGSGTTTVTATFTDALDRTSAETRENYSLTPAVAITAARLTDAKTVTLTVQGLSAEEGYSLSVQNVALAADTSRTLQGRADFLGGVALSSTVKESAATDQRVYTSLFYQLTDPQGVSYALASPLLASGRTALPADQVTALLAWLFTGAAPILGFLADRAAFGTTAAVPAAALDLQAPVGAANTAQVFELWMDFEIARTGGAVAGDLETQPGIRSSSTRVAPLQKALAGTADSGSDGTLGLTEFATTYEAALSAVGQFRMTVATGTDRFETGSTASAAGSVWSVRLGEAEAKLPIGYAITPATFGTPDVYAPRPISNELQTRTGVPIQGYATGVGLSGPTTPTDLSDVDMDVWGRTLFGAVDRLLTPQFTAAIQLVGELYTTPTDFLKQVLGDYTPEEVKQGSKGGKKSLAGIASRWMVPVFADQGGADTTNVVESFYQQLLVRLANAYATRAAVQFTADVRADVPDAIAPRLFGNVTAAGVALQSATVPEDGSTTVTLTFTGPLQPGPASVAANFTVTDGPPATDARPSADTTVVTLLLAGPVTAGRTKVAVGPAVLDAAGRPLRPPTERVVTVGAADLASAISYTSPKLTLATGTQPLPFLVTAPELVLGATGEVVPSVPMDLAYEGTSIEHQIGELEGINGYQASSWLGFVVPASREPLRSELGTFQVPMVLRSFPASPTLPSQEGSASAADCTVPLPELTQWDYRFTYSLPFHYPQDRVHGLVEFNLAPPTMLMAMGFEDAFQQMAQFVATIPQVQADFDQYLAAVDATTDPVKDAEVVKNAAVALQSFVSMVDDVVRAADGNDLSMLQAQSALMGDASLDYVFTVQEGAVDVGATEGALLVTLLGALPTGIAGVSVEIEPTQYTATPYPLEGTPPPDTFGFVYLKNGTTNEYLSAAGGQALPDRTVVLRKMDVLQRQDAWSTVRVKRNEVLAGKAIAEPFVYTTPKVQFASPLFPTLTQECPIDLSIIGSPDGQPVARPLAAHLDAFFDALLLVNTQPTLTFQVEATYEYRVNPQLSPVQLPILLQAPLTVAVGRDSQGAGTRQEMVDQWSQAITRWFEAYLPACGGTLHFDLTAMSDLTTQPMPLLRLRNLQLATPWVQKPALPCLATNGDG
jgi:LysM repeat protein